MSPVSLIALLLAGLVARASAWNMKEEQKTCEVTIKQGRLQGTVVEPRFSVHTNVVMPSVHVYLGVPYAASNERFMPPRQPPHWQETRTAHDFAPACAQNEPPMANISAGRYAYIKRLLPFLKNSSEDCLYLNIYAPSQARGGPVGEKYPVIVYIHGESYEWNSGNPYDGTILASYGKVVVVTLNFRLGIFGFLSPGFENEAMTNLGLWDQIAALQWIKDNIHEFGGNASSVTLMGHGTGAACVNLLLVSPIVERTPEGLFHRAILMSGTALADWALTSNHLLVTVQAAKELNCPSDRGLLQCLRKKRISDLLGVHIGLEPFSTPFGPVVDGRVVPNESSLTMGKYQSLFSRYELLYGVTEVESYHLLNKVALAHGVLETDRQRILKEYVQHRFQVHSNYAVAATENEYLDGFRKDAEYQRDALLDLLSDARVVAPMVQTADYHSSVNNRSYFYVFKHYSTEYETHRKRSIVGEEIPYVFGAPIKNYQTYQKRYTKEEKLLSETIMTYWTNFARSGNPNLGQRMPHTRMVEWPEYDTLGKKHIELGVDIRVGHHYRERFVDFWNYDLPNKLSNVKEPFYTDFDDTTPRLKLPPIINERNDMYENFDKPFDVTTTTKSPPPKVPDQYSTGLVYDRPDISNNSKVQPSGDPKQEEHGAESTMADSSSVALSIVIIIGVCFLLVNMCAFAGLYYQRDKLKVQEQLMRQKYEDVALSDGNINVNDRYVRKKMESDIEGRIPSIGKKGRKKKDVGDDDYEAIRSAGQTLEGHVSPPGAASPPRRWRLSRQCSASTMDPHTKVREWIAHEIVDRYSPHFMRRKRQHAPVQTNQAAAALQSSQSFETSLDQDSTLTAPRPYVHQTPMASPTDGSRKTTSTMQRQKVKKVSVAVDATPSARGASIQRQLSSDQSMSKSMDELTTCVSTSMLTLKKPNLKRSATTAEDLALVPVEVPLTNSESKSMIRRSTTSINLRLRQPNKSEGELKIEHKHSRSDPVPSTNAFVNPRNDYTEQLAKSKHINPHVINIPLEPAMTPSTSYLPNVKKKPLQTFPTGVHLRTKPVPKKDAAITASPLLDNSKDINVTSRDSTEINKVQHGDPLANIQKRKYPKVLPDFPQDTNTDHADPTPPLSTAAKRRSLPSNSLLIVGAQQLGSVSQPTTPSSPLVKDIPGKGNYVKVPPPPPPRVSTLGRKPTNTTPLMPLLPGVTETKSSEPSATIQPTSSTAPHVQRIEPKVIIKPTTTPISKKAQGARANQNIPRVTPGNPITKKAVMASNAGVTQTVPSISEVEKQIPNMVSSPTGLPSCVAVQTNAPDTPKTKSEPSSPGKKRLPLVVKKNNNSSTDGFETSSSTGTVKRAKVPSASKAVVAKPTSTTSTNTDTTTKISKSQPPKKWYAQYNQSFLSKARDDSDQQA